MSNAADPTEEQMAEYRRLLTALRAAQEGTDQEYDRAKAALHAHMIRYGIGEGIGFDPDAESAPAAPAAPPPDFTPEELTAAIVEARLAGDDSAVARLAALGTAQETDR